jgi:mono/diheme cytochrome c family protein
MSAFRSIRSFAPATALLAATLMACGGAKDQATPNNPPAEAAAPAATLDSALAPFPGTPPDGATPAMVARGDSVFHGMAGGGICMSCHGPDAKGTPLAPPLIKHEWLTGDGSYAFIEKRVTEGMPKPTPPYPGPMLPMGGATLSPEDIKAVSAYIYSISHP